MYRLFPMQQGMLFNSLYAPESGVDILQVVAILPEHVNLPAFRASLARVIERHDILRTAFRWEGLPEPLQEVAAQVPLPLTVQDWRDQPASTHQDRLDAFVLADRRRGFTLTQAPLFRMTLIQLADADYRLIWTLHHAILDGRSLLLMMKELFAWYEANCRQQALQLPQPRSYRDYIAWAQQQDSSAAEGFWRDLLTGFTTPTQLTVDQQRRREQPASGYDQQQIFLSATTTDGLTQLALEHDLTMHTLMQGAWALLLSRYSGQDDVVFGVTRSCRYGSIEGVDSMLGLFINTLLLRARIDPEQPVLAWLKQLRAQNIAIRDHQQASLVQVQQWSEVPQGTPLFNTILVFERQVMEAALRAQGGQWLNRSLDLVRQPNNPLTLGVYGGPQLLCRAVYDRQHFDGATIVRMLEHLQLLLEAMVGQPGARIADLPSLPPSQLQQIVVDWNATQTDYSDADMFHVRFERHASRTPDAVAVTCGDTQLTYQQLNARANQLAHHLRALGVGGQHAEVRVGVYLRRSVELIIGLLGTLKAGGVYLPLDPNYPAERLQFMLQDAAPAVVLTEFDLLATLPMHSAQVLVLDRDAELIAQQPTTSPPATVTPDDLAYMIYTSGSTGRPKGTLLAHRGLCNVIAAQAQIFGVQPGQTALQFASLNFDASIFEIVMALGVGARLLLAPPDLVLGPALVDLLREQAVAIVTLTPSTLAMLPPAALPALHTITVAGEVCPPDLVARWAPGRRFFNLYGPTEATIWTSYALCAAGQPPHIGRPIANTEAYILDRHGQPVPIGVAGELYLGGIGLARGYGKRPDLTAARFVPNPFSSVAGSRLYRTGDLACYLPDGNIEFLGRIDQQVKLRGLRIELGEIEAALRQHPALAEAVVLVREDTPGDQSLVAYVVEEQRNKGTREQSTGNLPSPAAAGEGAGGEGLRTFLARSLPAYMVPSSFVRLDEMPLTPSGKIDRSALLTIQSPSLQLQSYSAPRTPVEEVLVSIWTEVLKLPPRADLPGLGVHDHFFTLGGHSLLAMQVIFRAHEVFQVDLTLQHLFEAPTIHQFAEVIENAKRSTVPLRTPAIARLDRSRHVKRT